MSETLLAREPHTQPLNILERAGGLLLAPVRTFASLHSAPRWFDALVLAVALVSASTCLFSLSESGAHMLVERRVTLAEAAGRHISQAEFVLMVAREQHGALLTAVVAGIRLIALTLVVAAGSFAIVSLLSVSGALQTPLAPAPRFSHALSIAAHAALIRGIAMPTRLLLNLWIGVAGPSTSIGVLVPFLPEDTFWAHLGNTIDLFGLWWAHTLALGFALVFLRRPDGLRLLFIGTYLAAAVALAAVKAYAGAPSF
jgi:hypothetical protein